MSKTNITNDQLRGAIDPDNLPVDPTDDAYKLVRLDEEGQLQMRSLYKTNVNPYGGVKVDLKGDSTISTNTPTKIKEILYKDFNGKIRITCNFKGTNSSNGNYSTAIHINGVEVFEETAINLSEKFIDEEVDVNSGDLVQIYAYKNNGYTGSLTVKDVKIYYGYDNNYEVYLI